MGIFSALKKIKQLGVDGAVDVGGGTFKSYEQIVAEVGGNVVQEGLRYSDDQTANTIIKNYIHLFFFGKREICVVARDYRETPENKNIKE